MARDKAYVLTDVSLSVREGEFLSVMGPSGSGKSTLVNLIGMLDAPSEGCHYFLGEAVHLLTEKARAALAKKHIGFVFQAYHLIDELTVEQNIETPLIYHHVRASDRKVLVADMLDRFQIAGKKDFFPRQLSGGQQQRVGIARALISSPRLLVADEPTGNLSSREGEQIMALFKTLNSQGVTIIQVTHSEKNASYGQRTVHLLDGKIVNEDSGGLLYDHSTGERNL